MEWTSKYRPESLSDVRGNNKSVRELKDWAEGWEDHREPALVYGEPGVGKTSAVHALASDMGWEKMELNASDQRTSDAVESVAGEAAKSGTLTGNRQLIILDEADNLHGNADRGGSRAVTEVVKNASQPVVLIANEYYDMSNALKNACREVEFRNVSSRSIVPVLRDICRNEGIDFEKEALKNIGDSNSGDLRGAVNDLQAVAEGVDKLTASMTEVSGSRDSEEDIFEFLDTLFKGDGFQQALWDARDVDESPDDLIHWVDDNMPKVYDGEELKEGYEYLARADVYLGRTRATQNYGLWRYVNDLMVGGVNSAKRGDKGGWTRYSPPSTFRRLGRSRSKRETRDSIARKIGENCTLSMSEARRNVVPFLELLFGDNEVAMRISSSLNLSTDEVKFITGWNKSRAEKVVEEEVVKEQIEVEEKDESQSTLTNF
ncbi:MAG: replication factor C large subunit [Halobacteria archaeon]